MSHILLILVDSLRPQQLGCYAGKDMGTPNLDELAQRGVAFQNAFAQSPLSRPSIASVMTGLYPSQHGLVDRVKASKKSVTTLDPSLPTLAELLATDGYTTAAFLGGNANLKPVFSITRAFAHVVWRPTTDGVVVTEDFEQWFHTKRRDRTFCYLHFMDLRHFLPAVKSVSCLGSAPELQLVNESMIEFVSHYCAAVRRMDQHIGRVIRVLQAARILEDTLVIITADHGQELEEHAGMLTRGRTLYREFLHVPLIMKMPRQAYASVINEPIQLIDLMPTILDYAGRPPANVPGRSLVPLIRGQGTVIPTAAFSELSRSDRYVQSVTTTTNHFIKSYILDKHSIISQGDLRTGISVELRGRPIQGGRFVVTELLLTQGKSSRVRGTIEQVDTASGTVSMMGLTLQINGNTKFKGLDNRRYCRADLAMGTEISATLVASGGQLVATKITQRQSSGKSKIEGIIEGVQDLKGGPGYITVLGKNFFIDENVCIQPSQQESRSALSRVLAGNFIDTQRELYDITSDPEETENIVDERPGIAQGLERLLAVWTQALVSATRATTTDSVEVDSETLELLRLMGYEASVCKYGVIWENKLTRSALPRDESGWQWLRQQGVKTVVTFLHNHHVDYQKIGFLRLLTLPFARKPPTEAEAERFLKFIQNPENWPVHLHCEAGRGRAGTMSALVRYAIDGWPLDKALEEAKLYREGKELSSGRVKWLREWAANHKPGSHRLDKVELTLTLSMKTSAESRSAPDG